MGQVVFEHVNKVFPGGTVAIDDLSLEVPDGQFMILVGPSGCGKTTALRCVAGLEKPTSGTIRVDDRVVNDVTPRDRDIAMVFQNYALYPHMTVYKNLAFGLRQRKTDKAEIDRRVSSVSTMLGLDDLLKRRPAQLSGGQRQRVAMGRALVREPSAFLLDEPLSNLDAKLRVQMRAELKRLHTRLGITTVYVTHDQIEAMTLGDRIAVMSNGKLQQLGPPQELYDEPTNLFVTGFIGSPPMNLIRGRADGGHVTAGDLTFERGGVADGDVAVGIRPETVVQQSDGLPSFEFLVDVVEPLGDEVVVHGSTAGTTVETGAEEEELPTMLEGSRAPITARFDPGVRLHPGDRLRLGVRPDRLHLFDLRTGAAIR
ncbi:MAG: ABC transporter ATP-binding protein [Actinomycetota bacterium]